MDFVRGADVSFTTDRWSPSCGSVLKVEEDIVLRTRWPFRNRLCISGFEVLDLLFVHLGDEESNAVVNLHIGICDVCFQIVEKRLCVGFADNLDSEHPAFLIN